MATVHGLFPGPFTDDGPITTGLQCKYIYKIPTDHRRKIKIEENANVVAAVWGTEFPNLAALTDLL